jgi:hypothetical protein
LDGWAIRETDLDTSTRRHPEALARPFVGRASKGDGAPPQRTAAQAAILRDASVALAIAGLWRLLRMTLRLLNLPRREGCASGDHVIFK